MSKKTKTKASGEPINEAFEIEDEPAGAADALELEEPAVREPFEIKRYTADGMPWFRALYRAVKGPRPETWNCRSSDEFFVIEENGRPVAMQGILTKVCEVDGHEHLVGGLGYGSTLAEYEGKGFSSALIETALSQFSRVRCAYALLFCLDPLREHYLKRGWSRLDCAKVTIREAGRPVHLPEEVSAFVKSLGGLPIPERIDIRGLPW